MITSATVLANADAIIAACSQFRALATDLMAQVARNLEMQPSDFADLGAPWMDRDAPGTLESGWEFSFHGMECCLSHPMTDRAGGIADIEGGDL